MNIAGVILAGGGGSRLGHVLKANIEIGGRTLLSRVAQSFTACAPLLLSVGPHDPTAFRDAMGMTPVADLPSDYGGPLAGIVSAAAYLGRVQHVPDLLLTAACDSPLLPPDYLERLARSIAAAPGAVAACNGVLYPTNALWRLDALLPLVSAVRAGSAPHSMKRFAAEMGAATCAWNVGSMGDPFANANTPDDLAALSAKLGRND
jgi:molybdopterin-guanine dinucleotide biosynthesis protein A